MSAKKVVARFEASADIVSRLGAELFTDSSQALLELVKNCYDADATKVELEISRAGSGANRGSLLLSDNGTGMTEQAIRNSWLRLSFSPKREQKRSGEKTRRGRTPLGDKGLGRLGAQLLGVALQIRTRPEGERLEQVVSFDFSDFRAERSLADVPVNWRREADPPRKSWPFREKHGTVVTITDLVDADRWADPDHLERELGKLLNPFAEIAAFDLRAIVDSRELEVQRLGRNVRESALQRWRVDYDGKALRFEGLVRLPWFQVRDERQRELLQAALRKDRGKRLVELMRERNSAASDVRVTMARSPWLIRMSRRIPVDQIAGIPGAEPDCGPFEMELDVVARRFEIAQAASLSVFDAAKEYRDWLDAQAGVRIYRNGFVVAAGYDLLRLGVGFTKAASFYSLRPANVIGFVEITADGNSALEETTDREGFRDNAAFRRFDALLIEARDQVNRVMDAAGRAGVALAKELQEEDEGAIDPGPEGLASEAATVADAATAAQEKVEEASRGLRDWAGGAEMSREEEEVLDQAQEALSSADDALEEVKRLAPAAEDVAQDFEDLQENFQDLYQTIGLGLAAEGIAHEITHVVQRLGDRARLAHEEMATAGGGASPNLTILVEEVDAAAKGLRGQLKHLDPQLRRARARRRAIDLGEFVEELGKYHRERLADSGISVRTTKRRAEQVWASPGRLAQVLDNLVLNSEYWVRRELEKHGGPGEIRVTASGRKIHVADSGPGVPAEMVEAVFRPYVSMKSHGRGLGLFVARQLLEIDGGELGLRETPDGRRSIFVIDLTGARREELD